MKTIRHLKVEKIQIAKQSSVIVIIIIIQVLLLFLLVYNCNAKSKAIESDKYHLGILTHNLTQMKVSDNNMRFYMNQLNEDRFSLKKDNDILIRDIDILKRENEESFIAFSSKKEKALYLNKEITMMKESIDQFMLLITISKSIEEIKREKGSISNQMNDLQAIVNKKQMQIDSKILYSNHQLDLIIDWINMGPNVRFKLLYRQSDHGYSPTVFHQRCDNYDHTLLLVKSNKRVVFGGYTQVPWNGYDYQFGFNFDYTAFLFNLSLEKKYNIRSPKFAIYSSPETLASFGYRDLILDSQHITSNFPTSYGGNAEESELTGEVIIYPVEIELFHIYK